MCRHPQFNLYKEAGMVRKLIGVFVLALFVLGAALTYAEGPVAPEGAMATPIVTLPDDSQLAVDYGVGAVTTWPGP
jgi:hypothetical protein